MNLYQHSKFMDLINWKTMIAKAKAHNTKFKGKKKIDYDLVAYGVSRDNS